MKKSSFVAMVLGTVGGVLFALGMCMALIPEWAAFTPGVVMGVIGLIVLLIAVAVWRKMEGKAPVRLSGKTFATILLSVLGALVLAVVNALGGLIGIHVEVNPFTAMAVGFLGLPGAALVIALQLLI